uniref:tRNA (cytosine(38)-C(5))-methyltransferase n=1 Tax=Gouania willdenowi TaxID=441366 RepID=A0A8C5HAL9_GOUWI
ATRMEALRVLELYCGIGGMHLALKESGIPAQVVAAIDINTTANLIYKHNFPDTPLWNKTIEGIPLEDFDKLSFDAILMSPPCQPFTRIGLQGDISDPRTKSFLYILDLLPRLLKLPRLILLENVKGFETSSARGRLVKVLTECGYFFQELMVSPTSVGIPNSRLRYFLIAKLSSDSWPTAAIAKVRFSHRGLSPVVGAPCPQGAHPVLYKVETTLDVQRKSEQNKDLSVRCIHEFLEPLMEEHISQYLLSPKTLLRYALLLDIVQPTCRRSICFTKNYGRYIEGTGSVLQCCPDNTIDAAFTGFDQCSDEEKLQRLSKLQLRYFTPREVSNLMGFPPSFNFPKQISKIQQYRVLGNSLNVVVVSKLLQLLGS